MKLFYCIENLIRLCSNIVRIAYWFISLRMSWLNLGNVLLLMDVSVFNPHHSIIFNKFWPETIKKSVTDISLSEDLPQSN